MKLVILRCKQTFSAQQFIFIFLKYLVSVGGDTDPQFDSTDSRRQSGAFTGFRGSLFKLLPIR